MATNTVEVAAPVEAVFDVLLDTSAYADWVVGSKRVRATDATWPQPGSAFHHTVGFGPFEDPDRTAVVDIDPPRRLVLEARGWPAGTAIVTLLLAGDGDRTRVVMTERPHGGPAKVFDSPLMQAGIWARNVLALDRLRRLAEGRARSR